MFSDSQRRRNGLAFVRTTFLSVFLTVALSTIASSQEIPRSGFRLVESHEPDLIETFVQANVDQKISIKEFLRDASRNAELSSGEDAKIRGYATGFRWIESDEGTEPTWSPAGITLASDAYNTLEEREALGLEDAMIVSWWDARNRTGDQPAGDSKMGVRITIVADATKNDRESEGGRLRVYKHALLVEPTTLELEDGTEVASFKAMPEIQKPAIVWRDHWLYMIDSTNGIRVFDLNMLFKVKIGSGFGYVDEGQYEAYSHTHVLMQDRKYNFDLPDDLTLDMAWASLDRRNPESSGILVGEHMVRADALSKVLTWAFDPETHLLRTDSSDERNLTATANWAYQHGILRVTGGVYAKDKFFLPRTNGDENEKTTADIWTWVPGDAGLEYKYALPFGMQNMAYENERDQLWVLGSSPRNRYVVGLNRTKIDLITQGKDDGFGYEDIDTDDILEKIRNGEGSSSDNDSGHGMGNVGVVAGGVIGGLALAGIAASIYVCIKKYRKTKRDQFAQQQRSPNHPNYNPHHHPSHASSKTSINPFLKRHDTEIPSYKAELDITPASTFPLEPGTYAMRRNPGGENSATSRSQTSSPSGSERSMLQQGVESPASPAAVLVRGEGRGVAGSGGNLGRERPVRKPVPGQQQQRISVYYELDSGYQGRQLDA